MQRAWPSTRALDKAAAAPRPGWAVVLARRPAEPERQPPPSRCAPTNVPAVRASIGACSTMAAGARHARPSCLVDGGGERTAAAPSPPPTSVRQSGSTASRWNTAANGPQTCPVDGHGLRRRGGAAQRAAKGSRSQKPRRAASPTRVSTAPDQHGRGHGPFGL